MTAAEPCIIVVFGSTGDLMQRKLSPAIHKLATKGILNDAALVGVGRKSKTEEEFRSDFANAVRNISETASEPFSQRIFYHQMDYESDSGYKMLDELLKKTDKEHSTEGNVLFYFATPPDQFASIAAKISQNMPPAKGWRRVIIEKPFGLDLESARNINRIMTSAFGEENVFRIDHYMGKSLIENIMILRFANDIFEPLWNRKYIDHVQITVCETDGIEGRGKYYEAAGALKDMIQNHLLQVLTLIAMDAPASVSAEDVKKEKIRVLRMLRKSPARNAVLGQYGDGIGRSGHAPGYRKEQDVSPESVTETFAALKLEINNFRWSGVPFYLRTGKRMPEAFAKIYVQFKRTAGLFSEAEQNVLVINVQPKEGISVQFNLKVPGTKPLLVPVRMDFSHAAEFGNTPEAYERLLHDALANDKTLFTTWGEIEQSWKFIDGIAGNKMLRLGFPNYAAGTWGPPEADSLMKKDGREWINF